MALIPRRGMPFTASSCNVLRVRANTGLHALSVEELNGLVAPRGTLPPARWFTRDEELNLTGSIALRFGSLLAVSVLITVGIGCSRERAPVPTQSTRDASIIDPPTVAEPAAALASALPPERFEVNGVLLITIDALRWDQPWTGYDQFETPNLTKLANASVNYTRAYSLANLTTASLNAMLSSRYASELERNQCTLAQYSIPNSLAPVLQAANVATLAAHGHAIFSGHTAPSRGFDNWGVIRGVGGRLQTQGAVTGHDVADLMLANIARRSQKKRWFAWSHFVDPHDSYVAHPEFPVKSTGDRGRYDSEVAYTDAMVGRLFKALEAKHLMDSTAIIVTSDHGEAFGEHGFTKHGFSLYEEEIRVPLIVRVPGAKPRKIDAPRSALDIAPSIAILLGVTPNETWRGVSLTHDFDTDRLPQERPIVIDVPEMRQRPRMQAVVHRNKKVILTDTSSTVFDLAADPQENSPLGGKDAETAVSHAKEQLAKLVTVPGTPCELPRAIEKAREDL